jgi:hypothetical protein
MEELFFVVFCVRFKLDKVKIQRRCFYNNNDGFQLLVETVRLLIDEYNV